MKVFVYGTLKEGGRFSHRFNSMRINSEVATLSNFDMYNLGMFPGIIPVVDAPSHIITGELHEYAEKHAENVLEIMDRIEGYRENNPNSMYIREKRYVQLEDGSTELAWVYFYNGNVDKETQVKTGIWNINKE